MPKSRVAKTPSKNPRAAAIEASVARFEAAQRRLEQQSAPTPSPRRRLGHPNAAAYQVPAISAPSTSSTTKQTTTTRKIRGESPYPIFWVEVLDVAHQKWQPVDPLVTNTQWNPRVLEPPASDHANCLLYVIAFEADGSAKDVTRRYAKAYNSKTRRMRLDGVPPCASTNPDPSASQVPLSGDRWLRRALRRYARPWPTDVDTIEAAELAAAEAREPMPRNVQDFKGHPTYALARHLRRHEVLAEGAQAVGTVGAGSRGPLERIYRRRDVRAARSRDKWFRLGREVRPSETAVKVLPKRQRPRRGGFYDEAEDENEEDEEDPVLGPSPEAAGTPLYTLEQTEAYVPPPVAHGIVAKNKFGNIEIYVPSMVPAGGAYITHERAAQAAHMAGVDYAPALTGFDFSQQGGGGWAGGRRRGTAVLRGAVVPAAAEEGVRAIIEAFGDLEAEVEAERRSRAAVRMWSRFLMALRIRQRIWAGVDPAEPDEATTGEDRGGHGGRDKGKGVAVDEDDADAYEDDMDVDNAPSDVSEEIFMEEDDEGGGGFLIE